MIIILFLPLDEYVIFKLVLQASTTRRCSCVAYGVALLLFDASINIGEHCIRFVGCTPVFRRLCVNCIRIICLKQSTHESCAKNHPTMYVAWKLQAIWICFPSNFCFWIHSAFFLHLKTPCIRCTGTRCR